MENNELYTFIYKNVLECLKYNGIELLSEKISNQEIFNNLKVGSYERIEIDGKKDNKTYKFIIFPEVNKYSKKKVAYDLLNRYKDKYDKLVLIYKKDEQLLKIKSLIPKLDNPENIIFASYRSYVYNFPIHCHGDELRVLTESEVNSFLDTYKITKEDLPKIYINDTLILWNIDKVKKGDIIVVDDVSDNSGGNILMRLVI